jgi:hypothetical protein
VLKVTPKNSDFLPMLQLQEMIVHNLLLSLMYGQNFLSFSSRKYEHVEKEVCLLISSKWKSLDAFSRAQVFLHRILESFLTNGFIHKIYRYLSHQSVIICRAEPEMDMNQVSSTNSTFERAAQLPVKTGHVRL